MHELELELKTQQIPKEIRQGILQGVQRCFSRAAHHYDQFSTVQQRACNSLYFKAFNSNSRNFLLKKLDNLDNLDRLEQGLNLLDLGCGTGYSLPFFQRDFPNAHIFGLDLSFTQCEQAAQKAKRSLICADFDALPFANNGFDLVFSSLALQWSLDLSHSFKEICRILKPEGYLIFSSVGQGSLKELQKAKSFNPRKPSQEPFSKAFPEGFSKNLSFEQVQELLKKNQFEICFSEKKTEKFYYSTPLEVIKNIKAVGANYDFSAFQGLSGKNYTQSIIENYEQDPVTQKYPLTYEIYYFIARKLP